MTDFSLNIYKALLVAILQADYLFYTFEEWCDGKANGRFVILRHDVDLKAANSLATAQIEAQLGIRASYYFRVVPQSNQPEIIRAIAALSHEIGYHYEDMSLFNGDTAKSIAHFKQQLAHFRQFYPVRTICMHGSPTSKWDNKELWKKYNYRDYDIVGEPYFDFLNNSAAVTGGLCYFTDTARMWDGDKYNVRDKSQQSDKSGMKIHSTNDFIVWLGKKPGNDILMITTHPQRWTNNPIQWVTEFATQNIKNLIKVLIIKIRSL
jgi:hypothetical protein